jgi:hypothetical protein
VTINQSKVRNLALAKSKEYRNAKFTRVGREFLVAIDGAVHRLVEDRVRTHPSKGKTLK